MEAPSDGFAVVSAMVCCRMGFTETLAQMAWAHSCISEPSSLHTYDAVTYMSDCGVQLAIRNYKFTGKERDSESNLDNFGARHLDSMTGRFISPDPPLLDQHIADPQEILSAGDMSVDKLAMTLNDGVGGGRSWIAQIPKILIATYRPK